MNFNREIFQSFTFDVSATFTIVLKEPFGLVLEALGKPSSNVPFMMPKRVAETDPFKQWRTADQQRIPQAFLWGLYTGAGMHYFETVEALVEAIREQEVKQALQARRDAAAAPKTGRE